MTAAAAAIHPHNDPYGPVRVELRKKQTELEVIIETARLRVVSVNNDQYTEELVRLYEDKKVNALVGSGSTLERSLVFAKIARWQKRLQDGNPFSGYVVIEKQTGDFVGQIILKPVKDKAAGADKFVLGVAEIGYLSVEKHWGKKYAQEYTNAIVNHLVPELIFQKYQVAGQPITTIMATARVDNTASKSVLAKFMEHTGTKPRYGSMREWYEHQYVPSQI